MTCLFHTLKSAVTWNQRNNDIIKLQQTPCPRFSTLDGKVSSEPRGSAVRVSLCALGTAVLCSPWLCPSLTQIFPLFSYWLCCHCKDFEALVKQGLTLLWTPAAAERQVIISKIRAYTPILDHLWEFAFIIIRNFLFLEWHWTIYSFRPVLLSGNLNLVLTLLFSCWNGFCHWHAGILGGHRLLWNSSIWKILKCMYYLVACFCSFLFFIGGGVALSRLREGWGDKTLRSQNEKAALAKTVWLGNSAFFKG